MNKLLIFLLITSFTPNLFSSSEDIKITGEKWYNWNGSEWVLTKWENYERDSVGNIEQKIDYYYNTDGNVTSTKTWACTYTDTSYALKYYKYISSYDGWGSTTLTYTYDLKGRITAYSDDHNWFDHGGGGYEYHTFTYTYNNNKLVVYNKSLERMYSAPIYERINYFYDEYGRMESELKQTKIYDGDWIDAERTLWTYDGDVGTGVTEEFRNTVWIFSKNKIRNLNDSNQPVTEERQPWSWGKFINDEKKYFFYDESPTKEASLPYQYLVDTQIYSYDDSTETYIRNHRHYIYYDDFTSLIAPTNIYSSIINDQIKLIWGAVSGAEGYYVYSSADPNGTFKIDTTGTFEGTQWTAPITEKRKFYKVTSMKEDK